MNINFSLFTLFGFGLIASFMCLLIWVSNNLKKIKVDYSDLQQQNASLKNNIRIITAGAVGVGKKVSRMEADMTALSLRHDKATARQSNLSSYSHANKIAAMGGSVDDIIDACSLTKAEADLVYTLHKNK